MKAFIDRVSGLVKGTVSGIDRIVFNCLYSSDVRHGGDGLLQNQGCAKDNYEQSMPHIPTWHIR